MTRQPTFTDVRALGRDVAGATRNERVAAALRALLAGAEHEALLASVARLESERLVIAVLGREGEQVVAVHRRAGPGPADPGQGDQVRGVDTLETLELGVPYRCVILLQADPRPQSGCHIRGVLDCCCDDVIRDAGNNALPLS